MDNQQVALIKKFANKLCIPRRRRT